MSARIRLDVMKCDKIIQLPNQATVHGMRVQKYPKTGYVYCNGEDRVPIPNDGKILDDSKQYASLFTAVDGETMKVAGKFMSMATSTTSIPTTRASTAGRRATTPRRVSPLLR